MMSSFGQNFSSIWPYLTELLSSNPLKWVQLVYETKNIMGFFRVKLKTVSSQGNETLACQNYRKIRSPITHVKVSVDPLTLSKDDNFCHNIDWGKTPSALILPVVEIASKLDCI